MKRPEGFTALAILSAIKGIARPILIIACLVISSGLLARAAEEDVDAYKWRVAGFRWFSHPSGHFHGKGDTTTIDFHRDLGYDSYSTFSASKPSLTRSSEAASIADSSGPFTAEVVVESAAVDSQSGKASNKRSDWDKEPDAWRFIIYPAYVWVPFFSSSVTLPEQPPQPSQGPVIPSGTTSGSLNSAAFAGLEISKEKWTGTGTFLYAGLSATRTTPRVSLTMDFIYGQVMVGRDMYKGLSLDGGFRRMALDLTADVGTYPSVGRTPGFWDPLLGVTYRKQLNKKWRVTGHFDGGGFGVGSDLDIGANAAADWRFAKHFGMTVGGAYLHFEDSNTVRTQTLTIKPTMYGPTFGFGIYF